MMNESQKWFTKSSWKEIWKEQKLYFCCFAPYKQYNNECELLIQHNHVLLVITVLLWFSFTAKKNGYTCTFNSNKYVLIPPLPKNKFNRERERDRSRW